ncbi:MAG TPA: hypothetical protein VHM90_04410 [Phycisphaerae bacterium]|nr:hypothetical protein [Phycisphaerae bacterium]
MLASRSWQVGGTCRLIATFMLIAATALILAAPQTRAASTAAPAQTLPVNKRIFDTTLYDHKPSPNGMAPQLTIIYANFMAFDLEGKLRGLHPGLKGDDLKLLLDQAIAKGIVYIAFDIENPIGADKTTEATMERLVRIARAYRPELNYGCIYLPATYPEGKAQMGTLAEVQATNNKYASLIRLMDFLAPEAYLHDNPAKGQKAYDAWKTYMQMGINESHRVAPGKPVFPTLELNIADYGWSGPMVAHGPLPTDFLVNQMKDALTASGGNIILWGATKSNKNGTFADWDPMAPWYIGMLNANLLTLGQEAQSLLNSGSTAAAAKMNAQYPGR